VVAATPTLDVVGMGQRWLEGFEWRR